MNLFTEQLSDYRTKKEIDRRGSVYHCPTCKQNLSSAKDIEIKYCYECGQCLEWGIINEN